MTNYKKMTQNEAFKHLDKNEMVDDVSVRASLVQRRSPGKGFLAQLMLSYRNLSDPKLEHSKRTAVGAIAILPMDCMMEYSQAVLKAQSAMKDKSQESLKKAELEATLILMRSPNAKVIFVDNEIMAHPTMLTELVNRNDLNGRDFDIARNKMKTDGPVPINGIADPAAKEMAESALGETELKIMVPESPVLHPSWRNHFNAQARRERRQGMNIELTF